MIKKMYVRAVEGIKRIPFYGKKVQTIASGLRAATAIGALASIFYLSAPIFTSNPLPEKPKINRKYGPAKETWERLVSERKDLEKRTGVTYNTAELDEQLGRVYGDERSDILELSKAIRIVKRDLVEMEEDYEPKLAKWEEKSTRRHNQFREDVFKRGNKCWPITLSMGVTSLLLALYQKKPIKKRKMTPKENGQQ